MSIYTSEMHRMAH